MNDQVLEMQKQTIEQMKTVQTRIVELNERIAKSIVGAMPEIPVPFADRMPKPAELVSNYFDFLGEIRGANREFALHMIDAWTPAKATAAKATAAKAKK